MVSEDPKKADVDAYVAANGFKPLVVSVPGRAVLCAGTSLKGANTAAALAMDAALVKQLTAAFGGPHYISERDRRFIENWEVESYRRSMASKTAAGRLQGKVAVVTGAAQGFGYGIAEELAREGAVIVVADLNLEGAQKAADTIRTEYPVSEAFAVAVNVSNEDSIAAMVGEVAKRCGGVDLFVSNAGVAKAGSVKTFTLKDWEFVTDINYNGYFLCTKHVASLMAAQTADGGDWLDIVQVNSKSGLEGSNKNGAYAGSKFGGIGLTQSFALELVTDRIKVNSVCPGNYLDGPLWSNPERGLFVQYLNSGKVPGAKTVADVKRYYESKVPMNRGCFPKDVAKAIIYCVEQKYETGQAIPVTGGQVMLN
ncbi:MAG: SDR family NAD(P)-dependent oxidoreductase [Lentisphaeria bacterium]|nr:SDR family NAD(P)-dependent oxidoreductase [Lentisphaeria bacterium]